MPSDKEILVRDDTAQNFQALHEIIDKHIQDKQKKEMKNRRNKQERKYEEILPPLVVGRSLHRGG